jgi:hypothetical protein
VRAYITHSVRTRESIEYERGIKKETCAVPITLSRLVRVHGCGDYDARGGGGTLTWRGKRAYTRGVGAM